MACAEPFAGGVRLAWYGVNSGMQHAVLNPRRLNFDASLHSKCVWHTPKFQKVPMLEKLDFLVRFWALKSRQAASGEQLSASEQIELLSLLQLVTADLTVPAPGELSKTTDSIGVELAGGSTIVPAELRWVGAGALLITCREAKPAGQEVVLYATDALVGVEYSLPCRVLWTYPGQPASIALTVDGVPARTLFGETTGIRAAPFANGWTRRQLG
jgi:hypothetical protein